MSSDSWLPFSDVFLPDPPRFSLNISVVPEDGALVVKSVGAGSACTGILKKGDVLTVVDGRKVGSTDHLRHALNSGEDSTMLTIRFRRGASSKSASFMRRIEERGSTYLEPMPMNEGKRRAVLSRDSSATAWELVERTNLLQDELEKAHRQLDSVSNQRDVLSARVLQLEGGKDQLKRQRDTLLEKMTMMERSRQSQGGKAGAGGGGVSEGVHQRVCSERDALRQERDALRKERDAALAEGRTFHGERDAALAEASALRGERDALRIHLERIRGLIESREPGSPFQGCSDDIRELAFSPEVAHGDSQKHHMLWGSPGEQSEGDASMDDSFRVPDTPNFPRFPFGAIGVGIVSVSPESGREESPALSEASSVNGPALVLSSRRGGRGGGEFRNNSTLSTTTMSMSVSLDVTKEREGSKEPSPPPKCESEAGEWLVCGGGTPPPGGCEEEEDGRGSADPATWQKIGELFKGGTPHRGPPSNSDRAMPTGNSTVTCTTGDASSSSSSCPSGSTSVTLAGASTSPSNSRCLVISPQQNLAPCGRDTNPSRAKENACVPPGQHATSWSDGRASNGTGPANRSRINGQSQEKQERRSEEPMESETCQGDDCPGSPQPPHPAEALCTPRGDSITPLPRMSSRPMRSPLGSINMNVSSPAAALGSPHTAAGVKSKHSMMPTPARARTPMTQTSPVTRGNYDSPATPKWVGPGATSPPPRIASTNTPTAYFHNIPVGAVSGNPSIKAARGRRDQSPSELLTW